MFISKDDFRIKADNFDLTQGSNILRIIAGAFMFPHVAGKFVNGALNPGIVGFFGKAGFTPPEAWVWLAAASETAVGIALVLIGVACMVLGAVQHRSYVATLPPADIPRSHAPVYPILLCAMLAALGIALAIYLAI